MNSADAAATNVNRRHLTKGQRAMAVAKLYPEPEKGGRGKTSVINTGVSNEYVKHARTVLRWLPEIADRVMAGTTPRHQQPSTDPRSSMRYIGRARTKPASGPPADRPITTDLPPDYRSGQIFNDTRTRSDEPASEARRDD